MNNKKRNIIIGMILLVLVTVGIIAFAMINNKSVVDENNTNINYNVSIGISNIGSTDVALPAEVEIVLDSKAEILDEDLATIDNVSLKLDEINNIAELPVGEYSIYLLSTPVEIDGSTYKLPETDINFSIDENDNKNVNTEIYTVTYDEDNNVLIEINLERLDVTDMTKEQLVAIASRIENEKPNEYTELVTTLTELAESDEIVSEPESGEEVDRESLSTGESSTSTTPDTGSTNTNTGSNSNNSSSTGSSNTGNSSSNNSSNSSSSNSSSSNSGSSSESTHTHNWVAQYTDHAAVAAVTKQVQHPAVTETINHPAVTKEVIYYVFGNGHKVASTEMTPRQADDYTIDHDTNYWNTTETVVVTAAWTETKVITAAWTETVVVTPAKDAWRELTHYVCSTCGATKQP